MNNSEVELLEEVEVLDIDNQPKKHRKIKKVVLVIILLVIFSIGGITLSIKFFRKNTKLETNSFFIKNNDNLYAIFDNYGNKLSDFIYRQKDKFIHNSSLVCDNSGMYSIISNTGKTIVEPGKYTLIERKRGVYIARNLEGIYILNSKGKEVRKIKEGDISFSAVEDVGILKNKDKYLIINYDGDTLVEIEMVKNKEKPILDYKDGYLIVYYNNVNYIINVDKKEVVHKIEENQRYCISDVNKTDTNKVIVYTCIINPTDEIKYNYKVIDNGKVSIEKDSNDLSNLRFSDNSMLYSTNENVYLLDDNGKEKIKVENIQYIDNNNYAKINENTTIDIYVDNDIKTQTDCKYITDNYAVNNIYLLEKCGTAKSAGYYAYYTKEGKKIGKKNYSRATPFDENGRAIVSDDNSHYYIIDTKGNSIGEQYRMIERIDNYYVGINTDVSRLYDADGNVLIKGNSIVKKKFVNYSVLLVRNKKKYSIYNTDTKEKIVTLKSVPILEDNYFVVKDKKEIKYYSYATGDIFYSTT